MLLPTEIAEIGGVAVSDLIKSSFKSVFGFAVEKAGEAHIRIFEDFAPYMQECYKRNRFVRILCQDDDDVDLLSIYVQTNFRNKARVYIDHEIGYEVSDGANAVITGAGGAGKTFFMRKLWLDYFTEQNKTPIFIELKKLSDHLSTSVEAFIRNTISDSLPEKLFRDFMSDGRFIFILDGFDELPKDKLDEVQRQILAMAESFSACSFVVSSRPDTRFSGWSSFKVFEAQQLTIEQTRELCQKVPFDSEYQKVFVKKLTEEFYGAYKSFLSNPLLTIMMMMTFKRNMNISRKMGIFYDEAFATLYQWHDATKAYSRVKNLDIQQFRRSFGAFCLLSYAREKFNFSRTELDEFIDQSSKLIGIATDRNLILDDYERNVNLIRQDGLRYYFIHRSFQEYFAAWALVNLFPHKLGEFSERIGIRSGDSVISMCFDLHRTITIQNYILPNFRRYSESLKFDSGLDDKTVWQDLSCTTSFIMTGQDKSLKKNSKRPRSPRVVGIGIDLEPGFRGFFRSIQRMGSSDEVPNPDFKLSFPLYGMEPEERLGKLFQRIRNEVIPPQYLSEMHFECYLRPSVDLKSVEVNIFSQMIYERSLSCRGNLALEEQESAYFKEIGDHVIKVIGETAVWCKSEIDSARVSDTRIDELFLGGAR